MKRVHLLISGDVQGVGFRAWVVWQAKELGVVGWVRNREDGAVEVMAEGSRAKLEALLKRCRRGPEVAWVERVDIQWQEASGEFVSFEVIY